MLQEVLEDEDIVQVPSARPLVNISGIIRTIGLKCQQVNDRGLPV
jgi:hypothetical protein